MMFTHTAQKLARSLALLVAMVCLWCSSGGALHHTDDYRAGLTFAAGQSSLGQTHHAPVLDPCAAHEWEQTVPTLCAPVKPIAFVLFPLTQLSASLPQTFHPLLYDHTALRGPPAFSLHV